MPCRPTSIRLLLAVAATAAATVAVPPAQADSTVTATRSGGTGVAVASTSAHWTFTVTAISGKPAQLIVGITSVDGSTVAFASAHPKIGQSFVTYQQPAAGPNTIRAKLHGGPVTPDDSVTLAVDTP